MDLGLRGKRALVTGASKGIGRAVAEALAAEGCDLILAARGTGSLSQVALAISNAYSVHVTTATIDLSEPGAPAELAVIAGHTDILVNSAGAIPMGDLLSIDEATWRSAWDLKVFGYISLCRAIYPAMAARRSGVMINIIGAAGDRPTPDYVVGSTGNAALMAFTRAVGKGSPRDGIRVVGVNPGLTLTERSEVLARATAASRFGDETRWQEIFTEQPFGRPAHALEIAATVVFLASERSAYTSGTVVTVNGGA